MTAILVHAEVIDALASGRPVVALESAVATCGLPRDRWARAPRCGPPAWNATNPVNLEVARAMEQAVRDGGAVPATVGVIKGTLRIGLDASQLDQLASDPGTRKVALRDLPHAMSSGATAGTTVSATLAACRLAAPRPICVMATGGIGGVHRLWAEHPDISADLPELARSQVCVVCSGVKSILDIPATLEVLETLGIPVVGYGTDVFPLFLSAGSAALGVPQRVDEIEVIVRMCRAAWENLGMTQGMLVANPVPAGLGVAQDEMERITAAASAEAEAAGIRGRSRTPYLLAELARRTAGRSVEANIALLLANARLAGSIAAGFATNRTSPEPNPQKCR